ncbi:MAG: hypothetical protein ACREQ5_01035 [Candidatus Dormibacteria bacterium]
MTKEEFQDLLGEGMHTAFRKACDCPEGMKIHHLISEMPPECWAEAVEFVASGISPVLRSAGVELS